MTSSNKFSPSGRLPAKMSACIAAPILTIVSGSRSVFGGLPNNSATRWRIKGMRVVPPTKIISSACAFVICASCSASRHNAIVLSTSGAISSSNSARVNSCSQVSPVGNVIVRLMVSFSLKTFLMCSASFINCRHTCGSLSLMPASLASRSAMRRSKSSPPSALSPPVARTWNMPRSKLSTEMSNVPPPKS